MFKRFYYYTAFAVISILYIVVGLIAPRGPNRFGITITKLRLLELTLYIPIIIIWAIAVYGAERFKNYTAGISTYKDGVALDKVATGLGIITASIIINSLIGLVRPWALRDHWLAAYTIFADYVAVLLPLIGFAYMYAGSVGLNKFIKNRRRGKLGLAAVAALLVIIGTAYITALLTYHYRSSTPDPSRYSSFYMSDPLILLTLALPYLLSWGMGILAVVNLDNYRQSVKGVIYKQALRRLVNGTTIVILFYIVVQLLVAFSTYFAQADLKLILLILYLLILFYALGFLVIATGAKRLNQIEQVK